MIYKTLFIFFVSFLTAALTKHEVFKCKPGVSYLENLCSKCVCVEEGTQKLLCTDSSCTHPHYADMFHCNYGQTWNVGDEQCWCVEKHGTICTDNSKKQPQSSKLS